VRAGHGEGATASDAIAALTLASQARADAGAQPR
jgi:hypothetical protein